MLVNLLVFGYVHRTCPDGWHLVGSCSTDVLWLEPLKDYRTIHYIPTSSIVTITMWARFFSVAFIGISLVSWNKFTNEISVAYELKTCGSCESWFCVMGVVLSWVSTRQLAILTQAWRQSIRPTLGHRKFMTSNPCCGEFILGNIVNCMDLYHFSTLLKFFLMVDKSGLLHSQYLGNADGLATQGAKASTVWH